MFLYCILILPCHASSLNVPPFGVCVFFLLEATRIRLTLYLNVGTCETLPEPSVTLQMAPLVKLGHGRTLPSTQDRTMEITGV